MNRNPWMILAGALLALPHLASPAMADTAPKIDTCGMIDIQLKFNFTSTSANKLKDEFDKKIHRIEDFAYSQHIQRFELQNMLYNMKLEQLTSKTSATNDITGAKAAPVVSQYANIYRLSGSAEYLAGASDGAFKLGNFMTQEKFEVVVNTKTSTNCTGVGSSTPSAAAAAPILKKAPPSAPPVDTIPNTGDVILDLPTPNNSTIQ